MELVGKMETGCVPGDVTRVRARIRGVAQCMAAGSVRRPFLYVFVCVEGLAANMDNLDL